MANDGDPGREELSPAVRPAESAGATGEAVRSDVPTDLSSADRIARVFGDAGPSAHRYAEILATDGVERGLIGPREAPRLWERHLFNSAVVAELLPPGARVCDLGSGAGLPGIPLALARRDVEMVLLEPLLRRATFLEEVVAALHLPNCTVVRSRAEDAAGTVAVEVVTARAVAPMERLAGWAAPLMPAGGTLLALKGASVAAELAEASSALQRLSATHHEVVTVGLGIVEPPTTVARVTFGPQQSRRPRAARRKGKK